MMEKDERKNAEKVAREQREANAEMVRATIRAHEATDEAEAAQARAEESARELRVVAEFRELLVGIVSHDLRGPLSAISMAAGLLLRRGKLDAVDEKAVARIVSSSARMTRMITQLLDLTRARLGGGLPIAKAPTDLHEVCRTVVDELEGTVRLEVEGDVTGVWDPDRLEEVLSNLARNAVEHAAPETPVVVRAHADGAAVLVEVVNQGAPIPTELLPFLFDPFRRAHQREKSRAGNLGLGLYIAREIVQAHGGTLEAHSEAGRTTFTMRLPRGTLSPATT